MNQPSILARAAASLALVVALCGQAQATLIDRGGGMIYDTALNITWLQDWNQPRTSGYSAPGAYAQGYMTWSAAVTWADNLNFGGYTDWRLPTMVDTGLPGCPASQFSNIGGTDCGYEVQTQAGGIVFSEMAHLHYVTLGNQGLCDLATSTAQNCVRRPGYGSLGNTGPFVNMQYTSYWTGVQYAPNANAAWYFGLDGLQFFDLKVGPRNVVAVRNGDVLSAVPEPHTTALTLLGLAALAAAARRRAP